jgi:hypothetical protein
MTVAVFRTTFCPLRTARLVVDLRGVGPEGGSWTRSGPRSRAQAASRHAAGQAQQPQAGQLRTGRRELIIFATRMRIFGTGNLLVS